MKIGKTTLGKLGWLVAAWGWIWLIMEWVMTHTIRPAFLVMTDNLNTNVAFNFKLALVLSGVGLLLVAIDYVSTHNQT